MHSHSKLIKSGDVSYYSQSTVDVAQRALRESNEDSNEMTSSARPYKPRCNEAVFMVSSKVTWKEDFPKHKSLDTTG
jgi:hypothetical protein